MPAGTLSASANAPIVLTLPDGSTREVPAGTLARDVVGTIGARLLQAALAVAVDGEVQDLMTPLRTSGAFVVITDKDPRALAVLRHSGAHILATAVRRLRPDAKIGFGTNNFIEQAAMSEDDCQAAIARGAAMLKRRKFSPPLPKASP